MFNRKMQFLLILSSLATIGWAMTTMTTMTTKQHATRHPHHFHTKPPHESTEIENMLYFYLPQTHHLIIRATSRTIYNCYVAKLTDQERTDVHTDIGMKTIELKYLHFLATAKSVPKSDLVNIDVRGCGHPHQNHTINYFMI